METISKWAAKNRNALFLMVCVLLGQVIFFFTTVSRSKSEIEGYKALRLAGRVAKVLSSSHGIQKVKMATGETQALALIGLAQSYIQVDDSLVKASGSEDITIYRQFPTYVEVSVFGPGRVDRPDAAEYTGFIKNYRIKKP